MNEFLASTGNEKMTKEVKARDVITYDNFTPRLDLSLFRKKGNSKTYEGFMIQKMKEARNEGNFDVAELIQVFYKEYKKYRDSEKVKLDSWKGKSSFEIIEHPDSFDIITFQKPDKFSEPKEIKRNITKQEVNEVLIAICTLNKGVEIKTRDIAEAVYHKKWKDVFSTRFEHTDLNLILRLLDKKGIIEYKGGKTKLK
jgi:hypothetical protein